MRGRAPAQERAAASTTSGRNAPLLSIRRFRPQSRLRRRAAIHRPVAASDIGRGIGGKERDDAGNLPKLIGSCHRGISTKAIARQAGVGQRPIAGAEMTWGEGIHPDAERGPLTGQTTRQHPQRSAARGPGGDHGRQHVDDRTAAGNLHMARRAACRDLGSFQSCAKDAAKIRCSTADGCPAGGGVDQHGDGSMLRHRHVQGLLERCGILDINVDTGLPGRQHGNAAIQHDDRAIDGKTRRDFEAHPAAAADDDRDALAADARGGMPRRD